MSTRKQRAKLHQQINSLPSDSVAQIVRATYPSLKGKELTAMAKVVVRAAHEQISPKKSRKS